MMEDRIYQLVKIRRDAMCNMCWVRSRAIVSSSFLTQVQSMVPGCSRLSLSHSLLLYANFTFSQALFVTAVFF